MKKFVVLALAVILIGVAVPGAQAEYWNEGNYGYSEETAYVIDSISDFVEFQTRVNNGTDPEGSYYKLSINLNLAGNYPKWIPIGTESSPFKGHFNGNGKTITMYTEKYPETLTTRDIEYNSSLFGSIETDNDYAVKDLTVKGTIQGSFLAAGIVLRLYKGSIENCTFTGTLSSRGYSDVSRESFYHIVASAGGIAGYVLGGTIKNCTVKSSEITIQPYFSGQWSIYPGGGNVGGIAAELNGGAVEGCLVSDSTIQAAPHAPKDQAVSSIYLGGIVGLLHKGTLRNNFSYAQVVSSHANPSIANKDSKYCAGGIIGKIDSSNIGVEWNVYAGAAHGIGYDAGGSASDEPGCVNAGKITLTITTASFPSGNIGDSYSETLTATTTGGTWPVTWALTSGTLPAGLTLNSDGTISGSPTAKGTYKFSVKASIGSSGIISATKEYTITIADNQPSYSLTVKNASLSAGTVGKSYSETLKAELTGAELPASWSCTGTLPLGLTLNTSGTITGTPTQAGEYTFTVKAVFGAFEGTKSFTLKITSGSDIDTPWADEQPGFTVHEPILSGQIIINFYADLPQISGVDYNKSYVDFDIAGDKTNVPQMFDPEFNANVYGKTNYAFRCYLNSVQMADEITATLHYGDNKTVAHTYSLKEYIDTQLSKSNISPALKNILEAMKDYGHYAQLGLSEANGWTIGKDHKEMECANVYTDDDLQETLQAVRSYEIVRDTGNSGIESVPYRLRLDSDITLELNIVPASDYYGSVFASLNGGSENMAVKTSGGYLVQISGISAHKLGDTYTVTVTTSRGSFDVKVSALSYVYTSLTSANTAPGTTGSPAMKKAVTSLYKYYMATMAYRESIGMK